MLPVLAFILAPAFAAGPMDRVPTVPDLRQPAPVVRLLVTPPRDPEGFPELSEHVQALQLAVSAAQGQARVLHGDALNEETPVQHVVEASAAAAPRVQRDLEALGRRVVRLDHLAESALQTRRALSVGTDADAAAAASALMDHARHPRDLTEGLGAVLTGIEKTDVRPLPEETRRNLARVVYKNTFVLHDALDTLAGDLRIQERRRARSQDAPPADPSAASAAKALGAAVSRSAAALQKLDVDISAPLLTELLLAGDRRLLKDLASDDRRARAYGASYVAMLRSQLEGAADHAEERFLTDDAARRAELRVKRVEVDPPRAAVWSYDKAALHYVYIWLRGSAWPLLGVSPAAGEALSKAFVDLLQDADALLARAEEALGEGPIDGHVVLDHALRSLAPFDPRELARSGASPDLYVSSVASILRDAARRAGPRTFSLVASVARRFTADVRRDGWPLIRGDARDQVEALEREVSARAAADGLTLRP